MKMKMYSVLDAKAGFYGNPWCDHTDDSAIRGFSDAVNDGSNPNNQWHRHPEDFALYQLGDFDSVTGCVNRLDTLKCLVTASALRSVSIREKTIPEVVN